MWRRAHAWNDDRALVEAWQTSKPFPHLVFDDLLGADELAALNAVLEEEPVETCTADLYTFDASAPEPKTEPFRRLREDFAEAYAPALERITGKRLRRAELRAYAYRAGHYLLPHSDHRAEVGRALAFAYYVPSPEPPIGGELELFEVGTVGPEIVRVASAAIIEPRPNRLVVFDVGDHSLHQVREVIEGLRISLSGWLYP